MKTKLKGIKNMQYEFKCDICSKVFLNKSLLQQHKNIHNNIKYKCNICTYSGKTVKSLSAHVKKVHTEPTIPCQVCGKKFHFQCKLKEHLLIHTDAKPHKCKVCGKGFNSTYSLSTHKLIHEMVDSDNNISCMNCPAFPVKYHDHTEDRHEMEVIPCFV